MRRSPQWEHQLSRYIESKRGEPFEWGKNDCAHFAAGAVIAMTDEDPIKDLRGWNSERAAAKTIVQFGGSFEGIIDDRFKEVPVSHARRGDLALFDDSVGVVEGQFAWFVGDNGLERVEREFWDKAWSVDFG